MRNYEVNDIYELCDNLLIDSNQNLRSVL